MAVGRLPAAIQATSITFVVSFPLTETFPRDDKLEEAERPYADDDDDDDELNDAEVNGNWTPQEKALHEARLKAKAKRRLRKSSRNSTSESLSESGDTAGADPHSPKSKVAAGDRKSRTGKGRGLPKKGKSWTRLSFFFFYMILWDLPPKIFEYIWCCNTFKHLK